jgi:transcriptional regulator with XRE-family HTH domain
MGKRIRQLRAAKGTSQTALAQSAKITREHLSRLEAGHHAPTLTVVNRLARALGVPVTELLE